MDRSIVSQFGYLGGDGDWKLSVTKVEALLQGSAVDIGLPGYDECFGNGRIAGSHPARPESHRGAGPPRWSSRPRPRA